MTERERILDGVKRAVMGLLPDDDDYCDCSECVPVRPNPHPTYCCPPECDKSYTMECDSQCEDGDSLTTKPQSLMDKLRALEERLDNDMSDDFDRRHAMHEAGERLGDILDEADEASDTDEATRAAAISDVKHSVCFGQLEHTEQWIACHREGECKGEHCTIHNRSPHLMRSFPQHWRADKGIMERLCKHSVGHPDPDEIFPKEDARWVHGCCGCCLVDGLPDDTPSVDLTKRVERLEKSRDGLIQWTTSALAELTDRIRDLESLAPAPESPSGNKLKLPKPANQIQWFKNGDHPLDMSILINATTDNAFLSEGKIVRRYRNPAVPGTKMCDRCSHDYHWHGWIDSGGEGETVCPGDWVAFTGKGYYRMSNDSHRQTQSGLGE